MRKIGERIFMLVRSSVEMVKVSVEIELVLISGEGCKQENDEFRFGHQRAATATDS